MTMLKTTKRVRREVTFKHIACDDCGKKLTGDFEDWQEVVDDFNNKKEAKNYSIARTSAGWKHSCCVSQQTLLDRHSRKNEALPASVAEAMRVVSAYAAGKGVL